MIFRARFHSCKGPPVLCGQISHSLSIEPHIGGCVIIFQSPWCWCSFVNLFSKVRENNAKYLRAPAALARWLLSGQFRGCLSFVRGSLKCLGESHQHSTSKIPTLRLRNPDRRFWVLLLRRIGLSYLHTLDCTRTLPSRNHDGAGWRTAKVC